MRKALNNNPLVQIGLLAVLGLLVAVVFMSNMGGGSAAVEEDPAAAEAVAAAEATEASAAGAAPAAAAPAAAVPAAAAPPPVAAPAGGGSFEASKGLPSEVVNAHESGDVVVLLVLKNKGIEDKDLAADVRRLESRGDVTVFTTRSKKIGKYSRIAQGVSLDRVPAMIVLHPLKGKLKKGEAAPMPAATVSYGYRGPESVKQAVEDALYRGATRTYAP